MTRIMFFGDMSATGFGTVTMDLGRELIALGHDVRFVSQNELGELPEPFGSRTFSVTADMADLDRAGHLGVNSMSLLEHGVVGLLNGAIWPDHWTAEAAILLGDYWSVVHFVLSDPARTEAFRSIPTLHYVPIEGVDLPPSWKRLWDVVQPVAMSEFGATQLESVTGQRPPVVYHGVDTETFRPVSPERPMYIDGAKLRTKAECKRLFGIRPDVRLVLRTDRLMPRKRYASLLRAMAPVLARRPDAVLLLHCAADDEGGHLNDQVSKLHPQIRQRVALTNGAKIPRRQRVRPRMGGGRRTSLREPRSHAPRRRATARWHRPAGPQARCRFVQLGEGRDPVLRDHP
jgi:glycosyltransferase involved in cell wall biosynthesis